MESKVLLLDDLGKKYGETHVYYNLKTPAEAIKLLCINYPEFAKDVFKLQEQGIFYKVQQVDIDLQLSDLFLPLGSHDLVVTPVISGSGDVGKFVLGGLMIGVGIISGGAGFGVGGALGFGSTATNAAGALTGAFSLAATVGNVGIAMVLSGIGDLLTPQPTLSTLDTEGAFTNYNSGPASLTKGADGMQTYAYTGATNSSGLGKTIPVAYGKVLAGSLLIGAQINTKTTQTSNTEFFRQPGKGTFTLNGDPLKTTFSDAGGIKARLRKLNSKGKGKITNNKGRTYKRDKDLNLKNDGEQSLTTSALGGTIDGRDSGKFNTKLFDVFFQIKALNDRPGDNDTAFIDGFITYQIIIREASGDDIIGQHQMTIQGLLRNTEQLRYQVRAPFAHVSGKNTYKVFIKIIDSSVGNKCVFSTKAIGYKLK
jgi:predicted phage tail protein